MKNVLKILFLLFSGFAYSKTVIVGVYQNPPKIYLHENKPKGIFIELIQEIGKREKWKIKYVYSSWEDCLIKLENEEIDILPDVAYSESRAKRFDFNQIPVLPSWFQIYSRPDVKISSFKDLARKKIMVLKDSIQEEFMNKFIVETSLNITLIKVSSYSEALYILEKKEADAFVVTRFFAYSKDSKKLIPTPLILEKTTLHYAVKKNKNNDLILCIDKYLSSTMNNPFSFYYRMLLKYLHEDYLSDFKRKFIFSISVIIFILIISLFINFLLKRYISKKTKEIRLKNEELNKMINKLKEKEKELLETMKQKELIFKELQHRTRNNMNVISAMIGIKANAINIPVINEFVKDIKEKIWAMSLTHRLIEENNFSSLNIGRYIEVFFRELGNFYPEAKNTLEVSLKLEPVLLNIDIAIPFCFVINELITRELSQKNVVKIEIYKRDELIYFTYSDNATKELEDKIVEEIIKTQLCGEIKKENETYIISFSCKPAEE